MTYIDQSYFQRLRHFIHKIGSFHAVLYYPFRFLYCSFLVIDLALAHITNILSGFKSISVIHSHIFPWLPYLQYVYEVVHACLSSSTYFQFHLHSSATTVTNLFNLSSYTSLTFVNPVMVVLWHVSYTMHIPCYFAFSWSDILFTSNQSSFSYFSWFVKSIFSVTALSFLLRCLVV